MVRCSAEDLSENITIKRTVCKRDANIFRCNISTAQTKAQNINAISTWLLKGELNKNVSLLKENKISKSKYWK